MTGRPDHYQLLGITRSANAAELRRAYREQALLHHPDKNPDRVEEATQRFQQVAEAYSVLSDPQQRAAYDVALSSNALWRPDGEMAFSVNRARDLFKDVFGEEFADNLAKAAGSLAGGLEKVAKGAAPHVEAAAAATASGLSMAADRAGRSSVVLGAVAAHLSTRSDNASANVADKAKKEERCRADLQALVQSLQNHETSVLLEEQSRRERRNGFWGTVREWATREQRSVDEEYDRQAAHETTALNRQITRAEAFWRQAQKELADAESNQRRTQKEEEEVLRNGASLGQAANAGAFLLGRLSEKILR